VGIGFQLQYYNINGRVFDGLRKNALVMKTLGMFFFKMIVLGLPADDQREVFPAE
jgi:hypothetical protein